MPEQYDNIFPLYEYPGKNDPEATKQLDEKRANTKDTVNGALAA